MLFGGKGAETPVQRLRAQLVAVGWFSWWAQVILSTISAVLLLFANSVTDRISIFALVGRGFALGGLGCAIASTLWSLGYARLAARINKQGMPPEEAASAARGLVRFGMTINLLGTGLCLIGAETIVGTLAAKALTQSQSAVLGIAASPVQALDILIVQANTNTLGAHFLSLLGCLKLRGECEALESSIAS
jgi:hypothetical protein